MNAAAMLPVHAQRDEDAALGAAWRRCRAALLITEGVIAQLTLDATSGFGQPTGFHVTGWRSGTGEFEGPHCYSEVEALTRFAEQLETRQAAE